jgi:hypothetical protein
VLRYLNCVYWFFRKYVNEESAKLKNDIIKEIHNKIISLKVDAVTRCNRAFLGINVQ